MIGNDAELELWNRSVAEACRTIVSCRKQVESAKQEAADDPHAAEALPRRLDLVWPHMVHAALRLCDLQEQRPPSHKYRPASRDAREAELRLGVPLGTFRGAFSEQPPNAWLSVRRSLEIARDLAQAEQRATNPSTLSKLAEIDLGSAIIRVCCATVVGALVGAPLGALAIHENILTKMYEAAAVIGVTALATEIYNPLLASREHQPAEPVVDARMSAIDAVIAIMNDSTAAGGLNEPDEWLTPPNSISTEPPGQRQRIDVGPGALDPPTATPTGLNKVEDYTLDTGSNMPTFPHSAPPDTPPRQPDPRNLDGNTLPRGTTTQSCSRAINGAPAATDALDHRDTTRPHDRGDPTGNSTSSPPR